jgi:hypothetical protein
MTGRSKRRSKGSDLRIDIESWLASNSVDGIADYVSRGRRHAKLQSDALFEAWKGAIRAMAAQPFSETHRADELDLLAEIKFRGLKAPYEDKDVKNAAEKLISKVTEATEKLLQNPEDAERLNEEIMADIQEFKHRRDRAQ